MDPLADLATELDRLREQGLLRAPEPQSVAQDCLVFCANDYLAYAGQAPTGDFAATVPGGAGASRLISGNYREHQALEEKLAQWVACESALLFSSGYAANVGLISALAGPEDLIVSDTLNHASIIDGCRLSRAQIRIVPHCDADAVAHALQAANNVRRRLVITESYFSMDGDTPDLPRLRALCHDHDAALIVDEAHALGIFGPQGGGLCREKNVLPDALIGTLGKAVGLQGAFIAGSATLYRWLWNRARSFVFSTAPSPWLAAILQTRIEQIAHDDAARTRLQTLCTSFRAALQQRKAPIAPSHGPIVPWMVGAPEHAVLASQQLRDHGLFVQAIRPPTVPEGRSRLRITLNAGLSDAQLEQAITILSKVLLAPTMG